MEAFVSGLSDMLEVSRPIKLQSVGVTNSRPQQSALDPKLRERLEQLNRTDIEFYSQIRSLKQKMVEAVDADKVVATSKWRPWDGQTRNAIECEGFKVVAAEIDNQRVEQGASVCFKLRFEVSRNFHDVVVGFHIHDENRRTVYGTNTEILGDGALSLGIGVHEIEFIFDANLAFGRYKIGYGVEFKEAHGDFDFQVLAWGDSVQSLSVYGNAKSGSVGIVDLPVRHRICLSL